MVFKKTKSLTGTFSGGVSMSLERNGGGLAADLIPRETHQNEQGRPLDEMDTCSAFLGSTCIITSQTNELINCVPSSQVG